ncbi:hypothetical protein N7516_010020 [Penicillium verrucosum]|uniref:uncharacterized protein n=1 Tax=Penicillium verrucosum TaxID=60171 RepID=UPI00254599C0|nr:uncharacterized protein N7516_010020 [Penicillium verrucosum]KAJ5922317.1 hypothetical protein N7516_010020 [Penicillium verrucosum]
MTRTEQTRPDPDYTGPKWRQREYPDHQGDTVILGKIASSDREYHQPEGRDAFRLQIYSKPPIKPKDFQNLHDYFFQELVHGCFMEIYSYSPPDALACVEHQRREIAYRKCLHAQTENSPEVLPLLIPTLRASTQNDFGSGFCILLTSESYQAGFDAEERNDLGTGPLWIIFNRKFPSEIPKLSMITRLGSSLLNYNRFRKGQIEVSPETNETSAKLINDQEYMDDTVSDLLNGVFMNFVNLGDMGLRPAIISQLGFNKSIRLQFKTPSSSSLSCLLSRRNEFPVGALHNFDADTRQERTLPFGIGDHAYEPIAHKFFAVVLDRPSFITQPDVSFFTVLNELQEEMEPTEINLVDVKRSAGIPEVARRLAMLAVEEGLTDKPKRTLTPEEHRSLMMISMSSEYQSWLDMARENE